MHLHVLAGCRELLRPVFLQPESAAGLIGPHVRVAKAFWISAKCGRRYHDFLQGKPGDRRTAVMASALKDNFGTRFEPLLILADLLHETGSDAQRDLTCTARKLRSQLTVLSEILARGLIKHLHLHGLALTSKVDPDDSWAIPAGIGPDAVSDRLKRLGTMLSVENSPHTIKSAVIEVTPDHPDFLTFYNNALCTLLVRRLEPRLHEYGWAGDPEPLASAIFRIFSEWNSKGLFLALPLHSAQLDATEDLVFEQLLHK